MQQSRAELVASLEQLAKDIRLDVVKALYQTGGYHLGPSFSIVETLLALYYYKMRVDPQNPKWADRDVLILSKGHGSAGLYSVLARKGYFPREELWTMKTFGSRLQGHPDMLRTPGVELTTGSLGNGLSAGQGYALAARMDDRPTRVYVIIGDGEADEGLIWEASMSIPKFKLDNLCCILDYNKFQSSGASTGCIMPTLSPIADKWRAFGWNVLEARGHDIGCLMDALDEAEKYEGKPTFIIADTVKGKGLSFTEGDNRWHIGTLTEAEYHQALRELGAEAAQ
ncbi:MAG: transketolase [Chloroflexi bacterium]|nr:transketolase [Chloroflexota bacterium]